MLQAGAHALRVGTPDKACCQLACKIGVLAEIFKVTPAEGVALEVGTGAENKAAPPCSLASCPMAAPISVSNSGSQLPAVVTSAGKQVAGRDLLTPSISAASSCLRRP